MSDIADAITWACWGAVALVWLLGAVLSRQRAPEVRAHSGRDLASSLGLLVGVAVVVTPESVWRHLTVDSAWLRIAGSVILVCAAAATVWARVALGAMWSSAVVTKERHELRTNGPYRMTRHPIYTGVLAMLLGTALTQGLGRWVALLGAITVVLIGKLRAEERLLAREFPEEYENYRRSVPALLPRWSATRALREGR